MGTLLIEAEGDKLILSSSTGKTKTMQNQEEAIKEVKDWICAGW